MKSDLEKKSQAPPIEQIQAELEEMHIQYRYSKSDIPSAIAYDKNALSDKDLLVDADGRILGASLLYLVAKEHRLLIPAENTRFDPFSLSLILGTKEVYDILDKNPNIMIEIAADDSNVKVVPISRLAYFKDAYSKTKMPPMPDIAWVIREDKSSLGDGTQTGDEDLEEILKSVDKDVELLKAELSEDNEEEYSERTSQAKERFSSMNDAMGAYMREVAGHPIPTRDEELALAKAAYYGNNHAKTMILECNQKLVVSVAKKYAWLQARHGLYIGDLIQHGNEGLMRAIDKFQYNTGYKFSTFATWWIRQSITRAMMDNGEIRIPVHHGEEMRKLTLAEANFHKIHGRQPSEEELSEKTGYSSEKIFKMKNTTSVAFSIHDKIDGEDDREIGGVLIDTKIESPLKTVINQQKKRQLERMLGTLTPKEEKVIRMRYGIGYDSDHTLEEIGQHFHVTRERIRQIETKAMKKLKHPARREYVSDFAPHKLRK